MLHWSDRPRDWQADALLLRVLEVMGIDPGYLTRCLGRPFILEFNASSNMRRDLTSSFGVALPRSWPG